MATVRNERTSAQLYNNTCLHTTVLKLQELDLEPTFLSKFGKILEKKTAIRVFEEFIDYHPLLQEWHQSSAREVAKVMGQYFD